MVSRQVNSDTGITQIVVRANRAVSWRANVLLAASLGGVSAILGAVIAVLGFWMVLPFAGLEFLFVYLCLGKVYRRLGYTEVISLDGDTVRIESGYEKPVATSELPTHWVKVQFEDPSSAFDVGRLWLRCSGESLEIGQALNKDEKRLLHREMLSCLGGGQPQLKLMV